MTGRRMPQSRILRRRNSGGAASMPETVSRGVRENVHADTQTSAQNRRFKLWKAYSCFSKSRH